MTQITQWLQERRKAILSLITQAALVANLWLPQYAGETKRVVASALAGLTIFGVHRIRNKLKNGPRARR